MATVVVVVLAVAAGVLYYEGYFTGQGTVKVDLYDAPCSCSQVYMTVASAAVFRSNGTSPGDGSWTTISSSAETWDALALNGTTHEALVASHSVAPSSYSAVWITFHNVTVVTLAGVSIVAVLTNPTVQISGPFSVSTGGTTVVTLELNLANSISVVGGSATFAASISIIAS
jgi:hypothetical protein